MVEIDSSQNEVRCGDALFTVSSETPEEVGMSSVWLSDLDNIYLNSFCFGYRQDGSFDPYYLAYMLRSRSVREDIELLAQGISRFNISKGKVMEVEVPVPEMAEQRQVGAIFRRLDNLITLHQRKWSRLFRSEKRQSSVENLKSLMPARFKTYVSSAFAICATSASPWGQVATPPATSF